MNQIRRKWAAIGTVGAVGACVIWLVVNQFADHKTTEQQAAEFYRKAMLLDARGDQVEAETLTRNAIALNDQLTGAYQLAAKCAVSQGRLKQAIDDLSHISDEADNRWYPARKLEANLFHNRLHRLRDAEQVYLTILDRFPDDVFANREYAKLLGVCGRRTAAIPHVLRLIRAGEATDLLMLLSRESGHLNDPELLASACTADPTDPNPLLGQARSAISRQNFSDALQKLKQAADLKDLPFDFHGQLGQQLLANQQDADLAAWAREIAGRPPSAESWIVQASMAEQANDSLAAIRCYWEATKLRPESIHAINQLARKLAIVNQPELSKPLLQRVADLNHLNDQQQSTIMSSEEPHLKDVIAMINAYKSVGRIWEAFAWGKVAQQAFPQNAELLNLQRSIAQLIPQLPLELTDPKYNLALQIDLSHYPVPSFDKLTNDSAATTISPEISFKQQTTEIGFGFTYFKGAPQSTRRMFEMNGGGIAILDFDGDDSPDIFCTQGHLWDGQDDTHTDRLFRNRMGRSFTEVSQKSFASSDSGFGQGVSAGDVDNDGFPDLYVANTGTNTLWLNNGDGTFTVASTAFDDTQQWTASCIIADLNGDSIPDLYDVNYLAADDLFDRTCLEDDGETVMCLPYDFAPAPDHVWIGDGTGRFTDRTEEFLDTPPNGKGLGVVAMNTGSGRLSMFVANDTTANFFYTPKSPDATTLKETAIEVGLAFNAEGKAEACMGIAVADCTQDGRLDLMVTNFLHESNTLYSPRVGGFYEDKTKPAGLYETTLPLLGFGTQFLDANLDTRYELFVANGYIQDLTRYNTPYKMQPQMFEWTGNRFQLLPATQLGGWSETKSVGRAAVRFDWNRDGKPDMAVGLLDEPSFVLTNTTTTDNQFLSIKLVATKTARDAIGANVTVSNNDSNQVYQLTAGDGYQCSNERRVQIGCGTHKVIEQLIVEWPSGTRQTFSDVSTSRFITLVEGHNLAETLPANSRPIGQFNK